ncbi:Fructoselysine 3-epimerase [Eubacterium plexicaudatum ASF492]|uniref:Protein FrlC n=1 Tax=Eubacterium plexicaudatum ASF492 TaxID=1235802 RepID=N2AIT8_9FIRM|nr:Fructoselysine 3-epimerase [Eubacterium plexicaudatum ASF492]
MKIGMFTSGYQRNPLEHCFQDAKRFGYDFIELWGGRPHAFAPDLRDGEIEQVKRLIDRYEMPVVGYTPEHNAYPYNFMIGSEMQRQDAVAYLKICLDMAKEMGADYMLISPAHAGYGATYKEIRTRMVKTVRELGEYASKTGVKLVVETLTPYESNAFKSANDAVELFEQIDSPYVVGMCDLVPPYVQHESILDYLDKLGDKMYHFHIIDGEQGTDSHIVPGDGSIPLRELFMELKDAGYDKTATIELVTGYINEPRLYARRAIDRVRGYMQEAGFEQQGGA